MGATTIPSAQNAMAWPRFSGGNDSSRMAWDNGCKPPPHAPWMTRKKIRNGSEGASPQQKEAVVKPVTESISRRLRPKVVASHPVIGRIMALATRYDVSVHVASSVLAERLP